MDYNIWKQQILGEPDLAEKYFAEQNIFEYQSIESSSLDADHSFHILSATNVG